MIKKYNQFLKESKESIELIDLQEAIEDSTYGQNYSSMCKKDTDPNTDFETIQESLDTHRWTLEKIREEYTDEELIQLYNIMDSVNGEVDLYFYKLFEKFGLDKNIVRLGGSGWSDFYVTDDEAFIRYSYGYHNTEYGMMAINQDGGLEEFTKQAHKYLKQWIYEEVPIHILSIYVENYVNFDKLTGFHLNWNANDFLKISNFSLVEQDRIIIDLNSIAIFLNETSIKSDVVVDNKTKLSSYYEISSDEIYNKISNLLKQFSLDIDYTGSDIVIWVNLEDEY